tara:strand:- start:442 stop:1026 length:585 start_codon:yes stop_codon:yes gene_type:complete
MSFREISASETAVGAPLSQQLMQTLKGNQLSIELGEFDAPKIQAAALPPATATISKDHRVFTGRLIRNGINDTNFEAFSNEFYAARAGTYYVHAVSVGSGTSKAQVRVLKNGSQTHIGAASTGTVEINELITLAPKDRIKIELVNTTTGTTHPVGFGYIFIYVNNPLGDAPNHDIGNYDQVGTFFLVTNIPDTF